MNFKLQIIILFVALLFVSNCWAHGPSNLRGANFQKEKINKLFQDSRGFVWIGTEAGLFRFDGVHSVLYFRDPNNLNSLSNNSVNDIAEDNKGNIWIATEEGLNKLDRDKNEITRYFASSAGDGLSSNRITCLHIDKSAVLWMGTRGDGLMEMHLGNPNPSVVTHTHNGTKDHSISDNTIQDILEDQNGVLWVATERGLNTLLLYDNERSISQPGEFSTFSSDPNNPETSSSTWNVNCMFLDNEDRLWAADQSGLNLIQTSSSQSNTFSYKYYSDFDLSQITPGRGPIVDISQDADQRLVLSTDFGLMHLDDGDFNFLSDGVSVFGEIVEPGALIKLESGELMVGSRRQGVYTLPRNSASFGFLGETNFGEIKSVTSFLPKANGQLWLGTYGSGIVELGLNTSNFLIENEELIDPWISDFQKLSEEAVLISSYGSTPLVMHIEGEGFKIPKSNLNDFSNSNNIRSLYLDGTGTLWMASFGGGLFYCKKPQAALLHFENISQNSTSGMVISDNNVAGIVEDIYGRIWVGTDAGGINIIDLQSGTVSNLTHEPNKKESLSSNIINVLFADSSTIWVGTKNGLDQIDYKNGNFKFSHFGFSSGILGESVLGVLKTDDHLWLSTNKGLNAFSLNNFKSRSFSQNDGTGISEYLFNSYYESESGELFFGGVEGFNQFNPKLLDEEIITPLVSINNVRIIQKNSNELDLGVDNYEELSINYINRGLQLDHSQNSLFIEYSPMVFAGVDELRYRYKLKSNQSSWTLNANSHELNFSDLSPGHYELQIQTGSVFGEWSTSSTNFAFEILHPWWSSRTAFWTYVFLLFAASIVLLLFYFRRLRLRSRLAFELLERKKLNELTDLKEKLFTNISHEFRTPLTLILSPIEKLKLKIKNASNIRVLEGIEKNANELLRLINQLLDLNKLEAGHLTIENKTFSPAESMTKLSEKFEAEVVQKNIKLTAELEGVPDYLISDVDKIETIISNVLANAIKFSPEGSHIVVTMRYSNSELDINIEDEAGGIRDELKAKIFDRYYRIGNAQIGTGIGLSIVKELLDLLSGNIEVLNTNNGSVFSMRIPVLEALPETLSAKGEDRTGMVESDRRSILIADDNLELVELLASLLQNEYRIIKARDGEEGLQLSNEHLPDLILSDVMMPRMDGFQFCESIKEEELTNHIPVILITAKGGSAARISGLKHGADDYVEKPFSNEELILRVKNQLKLTDAIKSRIVSGAAFESGFTEAGPQNDFLSKLLKVIQENISDASFKVSAMAREIGMSRMNLNRKMKAIGDLSPSEMLRKVRLDHAQKLIDAGEYNVSESAFASGFNNLSHFTKVYKEEFGELPSKSAGKSD